MLDHGNDSIKHLFEELIVEWLVSSLLLLLLRRRRLTFAFA